LSEENTKPVRISKPLIYLIDEAVENIKDEYGVKKFSNRRDFVDEATKAFLKTLEVPA